MVKAKAEIFELALPTGDGRFLARYTEKGLCGLEFPSGANRPNQPMSARKVPEQIRQWHERTTCALACALAGQAPEALPPLDLSSGTDFQQRVWRTLRQIACARTLSYAEVAQAVGNPKAVRAVGGACGANPIPVLVPCHRVLAARQGLGGFSAGLHWKRTLLEREGIRLTG